MHRFKAERQVVVRTGFSGHTEDHARASGGLLDPSTQARLARGDEHMRAAMARFDASADDRIRRANAALLGGTAPLEKVIGGNSPHLGEIVEQQLQRYSKPTASTRPSVLRPAPAARPGKAPAKPAPKAATAAVSGKRAETNGGTSGLSKNSIAAYGLKYVHEWPREFLRRFIRV